MFYKSSLSLQDMIDACSWRTISKKTTLRSTGSKASTVSCHDNIKLQEWDVDLYSIDVNKGRQQAVVSISTLIMQCSICVFVCIMV